MINSSEKTSDRSQALEYYTDPFIINLSNLNPQKIGEEVEKSQILLESYAHSTPLKQPEPDFLPKKNVENTEESQKVKTIQQIPTNFPELVQMMLRMGDNIESLTKNVQDMKEEIKILKQELERKNADQDDL